MTRNDDETEQRKKVTLFCYGLIADRIALAPGQAGNGGSQGQ
jgi:hypothetical protein